MNAARIPRFAIAALAAVTALACSDSTGVETGTVNVTMQQADAAALLAADGWYASVTGTQISLDPDTVASLTITVTELEFLVGASGDGISDNTSWTGFTLPTPVSIDLMALPTEGESPLVVGSGSVPVGDYRHVRLHVSDASIEFTGPIEIGQDQVFEASTAYPVDIPSVDETGITTDVTFTVVADDAGEPTDVFVLFSPDATMANVTANGMGRVMLTPIISASVGS
ncbi:MAG: DUF4382 domain-containing protein [Gemmatimonadales bacterium]|jgi:hypothetical protein